MNVQPIGILSGLGPLAGEDVLDKILDHAATAYDSVEDADYPDVVLVSHGVENFDMTGDVTHGLRDELVSVLEQLNRHDPCVIGVACNTAHLFLDDLRAHSAAYVVNLVSEVARRAASQRERYLLLSSSTTRSTALYRKALTAHGVQFDEVSSDEQAEVDEIVHLVMAHELDVAGLRICEFVRGWGAAPFTAIIAGCTELPMALSHSGLAQDLPIVDSNRVLAETLVDFYFDTQPAARPVLAGASHRGAR